MTPCHVVQITTPKKFLLNGLWFGPAKPKRAIVFVHGYTGSVFSMGHVLHKLIDDETAVITFNNRGHDGVTRVSQQISKTKKKSFLAGAAHEKFADAPDDIQGAVRFARQQGVKEIHLAGHSTGCQKAMYWAHKGGTGVRSIMLFAPLSDYAAGAAQFGKTRLAKLVGQAQKMVRAGKGHELTPFALSKDEPNSAQRFVSLYDPNSVEQSIFSYFDDKRAAKIYASVRVPVLAILAGKDEYSDRSADAMVTWFEKKTGSQYFETLVVPSVEHNFKGGEEAIVQKVREWMHMH